MKLEYDRQTDSLYIQFVARPSTESEEIRPGIVLDLDDEVDLRKLDAASLPL